MQPKLNQSVFTHLLLAMTLVLCGCGGGSSDSTSPVPTQPTPPPTTAPPPPDPIEQNNAFADQSKTARFLTQATFGPSLAQIEQLTDTSASQWFVNQLAQPVNPAIPRIQDFIELNNAEFLNPFDASAPTFIFWRDAVLAEDQLRQRMAFALSQLIVVSSFGSDLLNDQPQGMGYYMDILSRNALGNYRDLIEEITYSPAMGYYLTYRGNRRADPLTGRMPDENYAREILQLFTIGLLEINADGTVKTDIEDDPIELFTNEDITGLAKVFTGLEFNVSRVPEEEGFEDQLASAMVQPMQIIESFHSTEEKSFLGLTIPANTPARESITLALDHIMSLPSVAPFISRQLIQRFVSSNPSDPYVARVSHAFESGQFELPDATLVGDGRKGDLAATLAAILFDQEARNPDDEVNFVGKIREPILRFTNWARAFDLALIAPELCPILWDTSGQLALAQHPFRSKSVFNFYRPGYIAPGTQSGMQNVTAPELQIMNATSTPGYINFMSYFIGQGPADFEFSQLRQEFLEENINIDFSQANRSFLVDYSRELALANNPQALVDHLNLLLTFNTLSTTTQNAIIDALTLIPEEQSEEFDGLTFRIIVATLMVMSSPDYLVQQ